MDELILTEEQAKLVSLFAGPIKVCDPKGIPIGRFEPEMTPELIAELKRRARSPGPWFTGAQVQARLQAFQGEWDRIGPFDHAYMTKFLAELDEKDPGHMREDRRAG